MTRLALLFAATVAAFAAVVSSLAVTPATAKTEFPYWGRFNSNTRIAQCDPGSYVVGFQGRSGDLIDQITVRCATVAPGFQRGAPTPGEHGGGFGGSAFGAKDCGPTQAVGGLAWQASRDENNAGSAGPVDMFGITCRELAPPHNRGGFLKQYSNDDPKAFTNNWMIMQHELDPPLYNFDYVSKPANETDAVGPHGYGQQCPADELATGIKFASGTLIDAVALICDTAPIAVSQPAPTPAPVPLSAAPAGSVAGYDRPGADYFSFTSGNPANCQLSCQKDATCQAWSWAQAGTHGVAAATCYMKRPTAPASKADPCCISGVRLADVVVDPGPAKPDPGVTFDGVWNTSANGQPLVLTLKQDASGNVTGSYPGGVITNGVIIGSQLHATWTEGSRSGRVRFNTGAPNQTTLTGRYNNVLSKEPSINDKPWNGTRADAASGSTGAAAMTFAGAWQTTINGSVPGTLTLSGSGGSWTGSYSALGITGQVKSGYISADGHLHIKWAQSTGTGTAEFTPTGAASFTGTFSFDSNPAVKGTWNGKH